MKKFLFLGTLFFSIIAHAQQDTTFVYQAPKGHFIDPLRADWDKKVTQENGSWVVKLYGKRNALREKISFEDQKLEIRKGPYAFYENGILIQEGDYDKGYRLGEWKTYFPNKQLMLKENYSWDKLNGAYQSFWDNGQLQSEGVYVNNKKAGIWKGFYRDGKLAIRERYNELGAPEEGIYLDQERKRLPVLQFVEMPSYPGGMAAFQAYIKKELKYPSYALKNKIQGTVKVSFVVNTDGTISEIEVLKGADVDLGAEAVRLIKASGKWVPGKELGEITSIRQVVPIKFSLDN